MSTIGLPAGQERAGEFRITAHCPDFVVQATRWYQSRFQRRQNTAAGPDDAREQLQKDCLRAQRRLQRLSMTVRPPLW